MQFLLGEKVYMPCPICRTPHREAVREDQKHLAGVVLLITSAVVKKVHVPDASESCVFHTNTLLFKPKLSFSSTSSKSIKILFPINFSSLALPFAPVHFLNWVIIFFLFS